MDHQIDFNHFIDITYSITSWEDSKSIQQDLLLGESRNLALYTYLSSHYGDSADIYDFSNGKQVFAFYLSQNRFLSLVEQFNLPIEIKLNRSNDKCKDEILDGTYIGFYLVDKK
ncbi:hypothetical protein ACLSY8_04045 [Avibacterium avium]